MKNIILLALFILGAFILTPNVEAKVLPQAKSVKSTASKVVNTTSIGVSPKVRADKKALNIYFSNLQNATQVSYMLRYQTNGQQEGAMGGLNLTGKSSDSAELLFGTCSKNVCRYHTNITDAKLEVSYTNKQGKKFLKKYKIKI